MSLWDICILCSCALIISLEYISNTLYFECAISWFGFVLWALDAEIQ